MMLRLLLCALLFTASCAAPDAAPDATLQLGELLGGADTLHARAVAPRTFAFPADHGPHHEFRTEWWYFTGNLTDDDGRELGYQLTFFRSALADSASFAHDSAASGWRARHAWMAHFTVTDATAGTFTAHERFSRGALGLAGATAAPFRVWLEDWSAAGVDPATTFPLRLVAAAGDVAIDLQLEQGRPVVLQGERGLSRKGPEPGNASYYYSLTRMPTVGTVRIGTRTQRVTGASWLDREWSTSVLSDDIAGWDWLSLQLSDSTDLMLYRLRREDGTAGPFSAGTLIAADGAITAIDAASFSMQPLRTWRAPDGVEYPVAWRIGIPAHDIALDVTAALDAQELTLAVRYWEGMVRATGSAAGRAVTGRGYLEMTGYGGADARD
jgi:predicted secreted hydrolase